MPRKGKRSKAQMSQRVKQNQTVKINIKNLLPPTRQTGDYIQPRRGMTGGNLNMGNVSRLEAPSIRYAVRPAEFLPLPERFNSQGQPQYFTQGVPRPAPSDRIIEEQNPNYMTQNTGSIRAVASQPVVRERTRTPGARTPVEVFNQFEQQARATVNPPRVEKGITSPTRPMPVLRLPLGLPKPVDTPLMDERQAIVQGASTAGWSRRSSAAQTSWAMRKLADEERQAVATLPASASTTGAPAVPATGFPAARPQATAAPSSLDFLDE
jgi:hypothetical protein